MNGLVFCVLLTGSFTYAKILNVEIVTLGLVTTAWPGSIHFTGTSFDEGFRILQEKFAGILNLTHSYVVEKKVTLCPELVAEADFMLAEWYYKKRTKADLYIYVSPMCVEYASTMRLLDQWNILMITTVGSDGALIKNKAISPTWVSTCSVTNGPVAMMVINTLRHFSWHNVVLLYDQSSVSGYQMNRNTILGMVKLEEIVVESSKSKDFTPQLKHFRTISRVIVLLCHGDILRKIVMQAQALNMTNGEYVYVSVMWFSFGKLMPPYTWNYNDSDDTAAREAFRSVLMVSSVDDIYSISPEASRKALNAPYIAPWNQSYPVPDYPIAWQGSTISAFQVLGQILNETLTAYPDFDFSSAGAQLARKFFNRSFDLGYTTLQFSPQGERQMPESLRDMDPESGIMKPVLLQDAVTLAVKVIGHVDWGRSRWYDTDEVPPDTPVCGFLGDRGPCRPKNISSEADFWGPVVGVVFLLFVFSLILKHWLKTHLRQQSGFWLDPEGLQPLMVERRRGLRAPSTYVIAYSVTRSWLIDGQPRDPPCDISGIRLMGSHPNIVNSQQDLLGSRVDLLGSRLRGGSLVSGASHGHTLEVPGSRTASSMSSRRSSYYETFLENNLSG